MTNYTIIQNDDITSYLSDKAFRLYSFLQSIAYGDKITCYPSQKYMAVALRCSVRTIQRALTELKDAGLISIRRRGSISNIYTLLQKKTQKVVEKVKDKISKAKNAYKNYNNSHKNDEYPKFIDYKSNIKYNMNNLEAMILGQMEYSSELLYKP